MDNTTLRNTNIIKIHGTMQCAEDCFINSSIKVTNIFISGCLSIKGNLETKNLDVTNHRILDVWGFVEANGNLSVDGDIVIGGDCQCDEIECNGSVLISGNCSCAAITAKDDVLIEGNFSGNVKDISVPEGCNVYINGELIS